MKKLKGLIIAPFDVQGKRVHDTISRALQELSIQVLRIDELQAGALLASLITNAIDESDFIIVDVTRHNPNVMYELGYAHGIKKQTVIITSNESEGLPTDLMGYLYIAYDKDNLRGLQQEVKRTAKRFIIQREGN